MKHLSIFFFLASLFTFTLEPAHAADRSYGVGFVIGSPTALSGRLNLSANHAADLQLAFDSDHYTLLYGDYLFQFRGAFHSSEPFVQDLVPYVGVGPLLAFGGGGYETRRGKYFAYRSDSFAMAVRVPAGIEWRPRKYPIGVGLEIAPGIVILPATEGFFHGGLSVRYYF